MWFILIVFILILSISIPIFIIFYTKKNKFLQDDLNYFLNYWQKILQIEDVNKSIIEADKLLHKVFLKKGYKGSISSCLKMYRFKDSKLKKDIYYAHSIRNKIAHELDFFVSDDERKKILKIYKEMLIELGIPI